MYEKGEVQAVEQLAFIKCSICGGNLGFYPVEKVNRIPREGSAVCCECGAVFPIRNFVIYLMRPELQDLLSRVMKRPRGRPPKLNDADRGRATEWLEDAYGLEPQSLIRPSGMANRLLSFLLRLLDSREAASIDPNDLRELCSVITSELMSGGYRQHVADPLAASMEAVNFEKYEDILLRRIMTRSLRIGSDVALIELGSGVGRILHQYGSCISEDPEACKPYRRSGKLLYEPVSLPNRNRLRLVVGVDFERHMLGAAARWMQKDRLRDLLERGRIAQALSSVRHLSVDFERPPWDKGVKVVCILFQTLGNQLGEELQVEVLEQAKRLAGSRGVVFVSVFNAASFAEQGRPYYESIRGSVGPSWYFGSDRFVSQKGVFSAWFIRDQLSAIFKKAGMDGAAVLDGRHLGVFSNYAPYIDLESQAQYKKRALIGIWSTGIDPQFAKELSGEN